MKALNLIAGLAMTCMATTSWAQNCAGHGHASATEPKVTVESLAKTLQMNDEQRTAFMTAMTACEKDCSTMASNSESDRKTAVMKQDRFNQAIASMQSHLSEEQFAKLKTMNNNGELAGLCGAGGCAKGGKAGCCAGKAGAHAAPQKTGAAAVRAD